VEEILDRYEQQTTDWLAGRLPRRSDGFACPDCGAEFRTEESMRIHRQRKHGRARKVAADA
jgi:predicted RNA-binding Zn-ribbon protein involved in translation (DUF1610 family)